MAQKKIAPLPSFVPSEKDDTQRHLLRLFYFIILTIWTFAAIVSPFVAFCITKNPESFYGFTSLLPPIILWAGFAKYLLIDERRFELEKLYLEARRRNISLPLAKFQEVDLRHVLTDKIPDSTQK